MIRPGAISFRVIDFETCESSFAGGGEDVVESVDGLESVSSLSFDSGNRGVPALSAESSPLVDPDPDKLEDGSLRCETGVSSETDRIPSVSPPELAMSDCEVLLEVPRLLLGTSCSRNFSVED